MVTFAEMGKMSRFWGMVENFLLGLLSWRLLMKHARGDVTQVVRFVTGLNPFCMLSQLCHRQRGLLRITQLVYGFQCLCSVSSVVCYTAIPLALFP